nr:hypothetical protein [Tanacetum cinerariifolium]
MSRDVLTVGSTMRILLLYRREYSQWVERFMNYLEEQTDGEAMINSIKNGDQPLPRVIQVSVAGTSSTEQPPLKDKSIWSDQEKRIQKINRLARSLLIQGLSNDIYSLIDSNKTPKDLCDALARHMLGSEYGEQDRKAAVLYEYETFKATEGELLLDTYIRYLQYATMMRQNKNLMDINIDALYNILKQNKGDVNDAMGSKKKTVLVTSDPLALIAEKTNMSRSKEKVVVSLDSEGSEAHDFSELKKITALLANAFNRRKIYSKPTNNNLGTSSTSQSANKKQEFVKTDNKKVEKKDDEKKRDMSRVKCYNCKKEGHFVKDCKKVKDYEYYKTKMLLAKKDKDDQVLLAEDQAWMESSSDSDQEINSNMVFMAQIEKVLSDSEASSSSADEKISEVSYYLSESESESEFKTSEYYDNSTNYGLFENNDDDQDIFYDAIESASENFIENHIDSQKDYVKSDVDHNDSEEKDQLVDKLIRKFYKKIVKCHKRVKKANQQRKYFENQNKDLQDKYDILKNQTTTFEMNNKELNEQLKELIEKNNDLLDQTKVLKDQVQVKHVVIDTHVECQEKYAKLKAKRYKYMLRYSAYFDNDKQHRKQIADQEVLYDKMSVQLVELDKHIICIMVENELVLKIRDILKKAKDLRPTLYDEKVIGLGYTPMFLTHSDEALEIEKFKRSRENKIEFAYDYGNLNASYVNEKINFEDDYFQEIKNSDFEKIDSPFQQTSSLKPYVPNVIMEKIIFDLEDEDVNLLEKEKTNLETIESLKSKGFESSENVISKSDNQCENDCRVVKKNVTKWRTQSVRRPSHSDVVWKKKGSSNTSNDDLSFVSHSKLNKDVKRYSRKDLLSCNNSHLRETSSAYVCNDAMNVSCNSRMCDLLDDNNFFIFDDVNVRISPVSKMAFKKQPCDSMNVRSKSNMIKSLPRTIVQICLWIIDSGCSKHMTGNRALLTNFVENFLETVRFGNNDFAMIAGYGDVVIGSMTINKVFYVEGLGHNLFSVGQFCDKGLEVAFRKSTCFVRNEDGVDLLTGDRSSNLYTIALNEVALNSSTSLLAKGSSSQSWSWHQRLSHLNFATINNLVKNNLVQGLPKMKFEKDHLCSACEQGKIHRKHHKSKTAFASNKPLYLLHMDLYEASEVIIYFTKKTQVNLQLQVQCVRTDNGTEFKNKTLAKFFDEDIEKFKAKGDIRVFVGYLKESVAFRIYNKRTRKIHESVNVNFDEISEMASKQFSLEPGLSNLNETGKSSNPSVSQVSEASRKDLEDLFQEFYDEYFDSSKIMKSSTTNVENSIIEEVFL